VASVVLFCNTGSSVVIRVIVRNVSSSKSDILDFSIFSTVLVRVSLRVSRSDAKIDFSGWFLLAGLGGRGWGILLQRRHEGRICMFGK
jgi:hypothetical protein